MTSTAKERSRIAIGWLGTGNMGVPMARNLAQGGYHLTAWNRTPTKAKALASQGPTIATSAEAAVEGADVVITMVSGGGAVSDLLFNQGVAGAMRPGSTLIDMSSIPPETAIDNALALRELGIACLDAPVSGGTTGAELATLSIFVGGNEDDFVACSPILQELGSPTYIGEAGAGQTAKLANQIIVAATIAGVAEGLLLTVTAGLDPVLVQEALMGGFAESRVLAEHGRRMIDRNFEPGGAAELHLKDLDTALGSAATLDLELPVTSRVTELFRNLTRSGKGNADHSAILLELERMNSLTAATHAESVVRGE